MNQDETRNGERLNSGAAERRRKTISIAMSRLEVSVASVDPELLKKIDTTIRESQIIEPQQTQAVVQPEQSVIPNEQDEELDAKVIRMQIKDAYANPPGEDGLNWYDEEAS